MTAAPSDITTRAAVPADLPAITELSARVFGPGRFSRSAYRVREGTPAISPFCRVAMSGNRLVAAIRMTEVAIGAGRGALLLGPLAVEPELAGLGYGRRLIAESTAAAKAAGLQIVVLVGDLPYYGRLGFLAIPPGRIVLPGPADPQRILALELAVGALERFQGLVTGIGPAGKSNAASRS
jgi:predicted N-acetyltransferase YhbS